MIKKLAICALLAGCSTTVPVVMSFPHAPTELTSTCPDLAKVPPNTTKLSQVLDVVTDNYSQYHECRSKVENWIDWYNQQQKIFTEVNK